MWRKDATSQPKQTSERRPTQAIIYIPTRSVRLYLSAGSHLRACRRADFDPGAGAVEGIGTAFGADEDEAEAEADAVDKYILRVEPSALDDVPGNPGSTLTCSTLTAACDADPRGAGPDFACFVTAFGGAGAGGADFQAVPHFDDAGNCAGGADMFSMAKSQRGRARKGSEQ